MRDPYQVLGLAKTASAAEIKSAFRKLAKKYHPDQSKEPKAKDRFAEVGSAYEILGDEKKRAAFDRGEIDAEGKPRAPHFEGFGAGRRGAPAKGRISAISVSISAARNSRPRARAAIDPDILAELFGARQHAARTRTGSRRGRRGERDGSARDGGGRRFGARDLAQRQVARRRRSRGHRGRQGDSAARPGRPGRAQRSGRRRDRDGSLRPASAVQGRGTRSQAGFPDHALRGRARGQGAIADAGRRGRSVDPGRRELGPRVAAEGQGPAGEPESSRRAICSRRCASCCRRARIRRCAI